jgi:hypothetical protein
MRTNPSTRVLVAPALIATVIAGCSGAGSTTPSTATVPSIIAATTPRIPSMREMLARIHPADAANQRAGFVDVAAINASAGNQTMLSSSQGNVTVWGSNGRLNALITAGLSAPLSLTTDAAENLYVVNNQSANVVVFPKPYTKISFALNDFRESPNDVAVSKTGVVAVTNIYNTVTSGPGSVSIYAKGGTSPCAMISDPNWAEMAFGAFDGSGNLFVNGLNAEHSKVLVGEISGGCSAKSIKTLGTSNALQSMGGVQVFHGKLLIVDPVGVTIYTYALSHHPLVAVGKMTLPRAQYPISFAMTTSGTLWTADSYTWAEFEYSYPGDAMIREQKSETLTTSPYGVAVNPAVIPD